MRHMCLSRISKPVDHLGTHPLALGVARQLTAARDASGEVDRVPRRLG